MKAMQKQKTAEQRAEGEREAVIQMAHGISPTLLLGSLPVSVSNEKDAK